MQKHEDLTGQQFNDWYVIKKSNQKGRWICSCKCGNIRHVIKGNLKNSLSKMCGECSYKINGEKRRINLLGQTIGNWKILEYAGKKINTNQTMWKCQCKCDRIFTVSLSTLRNGTSTGCNFCKRRQFVGKISGVLYGHIKTGARVRKIFFDITKEFLWNLFLKQNEKCALTGLSLYIADNRYEKDKNTASLDRIDSSKGYTEDNTQWVHKDVNYMKMDYDQDYFINICKLIANKFTTNKTELELVPDYIKELLLEIA